MSEVARRVHRMLASSSDTQAAPAGVIAAMVRREDPTIAAPGVQATVTDVQARLDGMGTLAPLLADPSVTDVLVNGPGHVWIERDGVLARTEVVVEGHEVALLVERIVGSVGRRADPVHPIADARLADGSRAHVVVAPVAVDGPYLSIRRFRVRGVPLEEMADPATVATLVGAVRGRANIIVSGGTGSGKTTLLNALAAYVPEGQRVITVEDAAELQLPAAHVVRLEARPASSEGAPEVTIRDLVRAALRMRPDRVIVGEVRGDEAADLLEAMSTGHDGSLATVHANGAADALGRLEAMVLAAQRGQAPRTVRSRWRRAVDLIVHVERSPGGARRVVELVGPVPPPPDAEVRPVVVEPTVSAVAARGVPSPVDSGGLGRR